MPASGPERAAFIEALQTLADDLKRREALAAQLAAECGLPTGPPEVTIARLVDRNGILGTMWLMHQRDWSGPDCVAALREAGVSDVDMEAATLPIQDWEA